MKQKEFKKHSRTFFSKWFFVILFLGHTWGCDSPEPSGIRETLDFNISDSYETVDPNKLLSSPSLRKKFYTSSYEVDEYKVRVEFRSAKGPIPELFDSNGLGIASKDRLLVVRRFKLNEVASALVFNIDTFYSAVVDYDVLTASSALISNDKILDSPLIKSLNRTRDQVVEHVNPKALQKDIFSFVLTVDMCQSSRAWDRELFEVLAKLSADLSRPPLLGVAMTGKWAIRHPKEFRELLDWEKSGKLNIVWINHTMNHSPHKDYSGRYWFLTHPDADFYAEVLLLEVLLIEHGMTPSPWFRFPGLVHNKKRLQQLHYLSLLPLDSNAWLAKDEPLKNGSVVLIHANGNDPVGLERFLKEFATLRPWLVDGRARLLSPHTTAPTLPINN